MEIVFALSFVYAMVTFNGAPPVQCLVDTGSSWTILRPEVAASVPGARPIDRHGQFVAATGSVGRVDFYRFASVGTSDLGWANADVAVSPDINQPCILGMDFLGLQPVTVDLSTQTVRRAVPATAPK